MITKAFFPVTLSLSLLTLVAFADIPTAHREPETQQLATHANNLLHQRCFSCHRDGGSAGQTLFVLAVSGDTLFDKNIAARILTQVQNGTMPPGAPLPANEKTLLKKWINAGTPTVKPSPPAEPAREFLKEEDVLRYIHYDYREVGEANRPFTRYVSIAHLSNAGVPKGILQQHQAALAKLFNSLSWRPRITLPVPVQFTNDTVFRIDLRDYGWSPERWKAIEAAYPYDYSAPMKSGEDSPWTYRDSLPSPPYLRADWLIHTASVPPTYYDLLESPKTLKELEEVILHASEYGIKRGGITRSLVSRNSRVLEYRDTAHGSYWRSYDFRNNQGASFFFQDPHTLTPAGGEFIYSLPNGLHAFYLADGKGNRLDTAPIDIVSDYNFPNDPIVRNGRSCMGCHSAGIRAFHDNVRPAIDKGLIDVSDRKTLLDIYSPQSDLDFEIRVDNERFQRALTEMRVSAIGDALREPVSAVSRTYSSRLTLTTAASEFGLRKKDFQSLLVSSQRLRQLGLGQFLTPPYVMNRDTWESVFPAITTVLQQEIYNSQKAIKGDVVTSSGNFEATEASSNEPSAHRQQTNLSVEEVLNAFKKAVSKDNKTKRRQKRGQPNR